MIKVRMNKLILFAVLSVPIVLFLVYFVVIPVNAETTTSNCIVTKVGNPPADYILPVECRANRWPFAKKDPSQYRRVDAGFDIQENHVEDTEAGKTWLYAIAPGTVHLQGGTGGGYGPHYPYVVLDNPITVNGRTREGYFYGHTIMIPELNGKHVNAGDKIAWTGPRGCSLPGVQYAHKDDNGNTYYNSWCGNGGSYWAEIGWGRSSPDGNRDPNVCINQSNLNLDPLYNHGDPCAWTQSGKDMKDYLLGNQ